MALTKSLEQKIEVLAGGQLQIRDTTVVLENGVELSRTHHRRVITMDADVSGETSRVQAIAAAAWG